MRWIYWLLLICLPVRLWAQQGDKKGEAQPALPNYLQPPPAPARSPAEALRSFHLAPGFHLQLVASEPLIQDPVAMTFDPDGRIYVVEMRGYMPNVNGKGEDASIGRISVLEDADQDGVMDRASVFLDNLVLPRALCLSREGLLVAAASKLWFAQDLDGDGKAEKVALVDPDYAIGGTPEHQPNGLLLALDNWIYNAKSQFRYRFIDGNWVKQKTEFRGQWGICQDNYGRLIYNVNDSHLRGDVTPPGYIGRNRHFPSVSGINLPISTNQQIFPVRMNTGVNRAYRPGILDEKGRLRLFTAACGPVIYRGDNFPSGFQGNAFICEPGANLIKRDILIDRGLALTAGCSPMASEFLASTDERFRPVNAYNGPDGALYIVDMYRGVVQHRAYITSHLRKEILSRGLESPVHFGRIYRVVQTNSTISGRPQLLKRPPAELVSSLSHSNGWWRDTAQRLLVERNDKSSLPLLLDLALHGTNQLGRIHALWTLEAMRPQDLKPLFVPLTDNNVKVQVAAIRVLESLSMGDPAKEGDLINALTPLSRNSSPEVQFQIALSLGNFEKVRALPLLAGVASDYTGEALIRDAIVSGLQDWELAFVERLLGDTRWNQAAPGRHELLMNLAGAILKERVPEKVQKLLDLIAREDPAGLWRKKSLLAGLAKEHHPHFAPIRLSTRPSLLDSLRQSSDPVILKAVEKIELLFEWPGHVHAREAPSKTVPLRADEKALFSLGRETFETVCAACHGLNGEGIVPLAPPLADSEWVLGSSERLIRIVLHGVTGKLRVRNQLYEPPLSIGEMPGFEALDDRTIAGLLTYIRRAWEHSAKPVRPEVVRKMREQTRSRNTPWTEAELLKIR